MVKIVHLLRARLLIRILPSVGAALITSVDVEVEHIIWADVGASVSLVVIFGSGRIGKSVMRAWIRAGAQEAVWITVGISNGVQGR